MSDEKYSFWKENKIRIIFTLSSILIAAVSMTSFISLAMPGLTESSSSFVMSAVTFGGESAPAIFDANPYLIVAYVLVILGFGSLLMQLNSRIRYLVASILYLSSAIIIFFTLPLSDLVQPFEVSLTMKIGSGPVFAGIMLVVSSVSCTILFILSRKYEKKGVERRYE